jgi:hypothetical protein
MLYWAGMKSIDWTGLYPKYKGMWVALDKDDETVVAKGATAEQAFQEAQSKGFAEAALTYIPTEVIAFAGQHEVPLHESPARL